MASIQFAELISLANPSGFAAFSRALGPGISVAVPAANPYSISPTMTDSAVATFKNFGKPADVLRTEPANLPPLADGRVRVRMIAAPVNPADLNFIEGTYGVRPALPAVPGIEGCGEIEESRAPGWETGVRVILLARLGSWRSHIDAGPADLLRVPAGLDPVQAAMLKVNPATAWRLLTSIERPETGSWVVQNAASSNAGRCIIQLARELGLRTVNLVRRIETADELRPLGADIVLADDPHAAAAALEATGGERPRLACNAVGGESALRLLDLLAEEGMHLTYGAMSRRSLKIPNSLLIFRRLRLQGFWMTKWLESAPREELEETYSFLAGLAAEGKLVQPVDSTFPPGEIRAAVARAAESGRSGKVILQF
jgi:NADPH:quinone reductase-like Zn-dependent oxidoreductase